MIHATFVGISGEILGCVSGSAEDIENNRPGETWITVDGIYGPTDHFFCKKTGEMRSRPEQPSPWHSFDFSAQQWFDTRSTAEKLKNEGEVVTAERNRLLQASDWTQLPDVPITTKEAWATYRQALRDITNQPGFPLEVTWPAPPQS